MTAVEILEIARSLDRDEVVELALQLLESVEAPDPHAAHDDAGWAAEIERRAERALSGESRGVPWAAVKQGLRDKLAQP